MKIRNTYRCAMDAVALMSLFLLLSGTGVDSAVDWTVKSNAAGEEVVESVVDMIQQSCIFPDDRLMLRRIAKVETDDGLAERNSTLGGIWRIDKPSFTQTKSFYNETVYSLINKTFNVDWKTLYYTNLTQPLYSGLAARLKIASYFRSTDLPQDIQSQAQYWAQHFTDNTWGTQANAIERYKQASNRTAMGCTVPKADVIFVLDSSGSITPTHFEKVRQFVVGVVQSFVISPKQIRVALVQFSDVARFEYNFTTYTTKAEIVAASSVIPYISSGTNTVAGLQALESVVSGARLDDAVPVVAILMTDGQSNDKPSTLREAARVHQTLGSKMTVYAVGVGDGIDSTELDAIATPPSCQHTFHLASFNDITAFAYQIMKKACEVPASITEDREIKLTIEKGEKVYFKMTTKISETGGVEMKVKGGGGENSKAIVYLSWTNPKPNAANYDYKRTVYGNRPTSIKVPYNKKGKSQNSVGRRRRRQVDNSDDDEADSVNGDDDGLMVTLYAAMEAVGEEEIDNNFEISYTASDQMMDVGDDDDNDGEDDTTSPSPLPTLPSSSATAAVVPAAVVVFLVQLASLCSNFT